MAENSSTSEGAPRFVAGVANAKSRFPADEGGQLFAVLGDKFGGATQDGEPLMTGEGFHVSREGARDRLLEVFGADQGGRSGQAVVPRIANLELFAGLDRGSVDVGGKVHGEPVFSIQG